MEYVRRLRNIEPSVYNKNRLKEIPIPQLAKKSPELCPGDIIIGDQIEKAGSITDSAVDKNHMNAVAINEEVVDGERIDSQIETAEADSNQTADAINMEELANEMTVGFPNNDTCATNIDGNDDPIANQDTIVAGIIQTVDISRIYAVVNNIDLTDKITAPLSTDAICSSDNKSRTGVDNDYANQTANNNHINATVTNHGISNEDSTDEASVSLPTNESIIQLGIVDADTDQITDYSHMNVAITDNGNTSVNNNQDSAEGFTEIDGGDIHATANIIPDDEDKKPDILPLIEFTLTNRDEIMNLLDPDIIEVVDDDMTIITKSKGFGQPIPTMQDGRIKLESSCPFSNIEPYLCTVSKLSSIFSFFFS